VDSEGKKFGKSEGGAVWLSAERLSPYKFYQYLFSTTDADVIRFMKMLTFLPLGDIEEMEAAMSRKSEYVPNTAQMKLAEVTRFVHGEQGLEQALAATKVSLVSRLGRYLENPSGSAAGGRDEAGFSDFGGGGWRGSDCSIG